ncbi:PREDICTED: spermatogenesis-associated protein 5 isoform X3 [Acromyrmex echinatior]|uniref:Spermatogenesis-associated protein 5 n=2 Tax=Acromyrmex echinatior TaxID=103372 RepID=F4WB09_ACREC|nr:PREDICTED: spermatogenesis-associated protein 5 isoform X3 [Acromyrmex echinatior]XP_011049436.1 PREDICTED: spermatogenesis-associated protein 5 isoform X3 [Acromyrmex echinatior]EGI68629.1 Spermatogenesis-associated protein 5 [Acromyrmex echinatior]
MSTKSRKSLSSWQQCEKCQCALAQKDISVHEVSCPPSTENWDHPFILNGVLYSTIEVFQTQELPKRISEKDANDMVFVSQFTLQLCEIAIGSPTVITTKDEVVVKTAWPTNDKSLTSVSLTKHAIDLNNLSGLIKICSLTSTVHIAKEIVISQQGKCLSDVSVELDIILKYFNEHKIFTVGNRISVPYYGKKLVYKIVQIKAEKSKKKPTETMDVNDLSKPFKDMNLTSTKVDFYKALYTTKWTILDKDKENVAKERHKIEDIGGYGALISDIRDIVAIGIGKYKSIERFNICKGILLYGPSGVGKSMIANAIISECNVNTFIVHSSDIYSKSVGETEDKLKEVFSKAISSAPSIILFEDVDSLCPKRNNSSTDHEKRVLTQLVTLFDDLQNINNNVLVMATTAKSDLVDSSLRRPGRLDMDFEIYVPTPDMRKEILMKLLSKIPNTLSCEDIQNISFVTHGFVGADLYGLCSRAIINAVKCCQKRTTFDDEPDDPNELKVTMIDFHYALTVTRPSAMKEVLVEVPNVRWSDIGGQEDLKLKLKQSVEWPLKHPEAFVRMGITPPRGVLMFGPPGCSKTMIAKALATESKVNFLNIKGPELFSKWVGESEKAVREVFRKARQVAPSIIFIDEIDALGGERGSSSGGSGSNVQERVLAQLLTELDGVTALGNVTLVAATNRPDKIDKALLRPGRLDRIIYVGLPDEKTRREIFEIKLRHMNIVKEEVNIMELVSRTKDYTGAEIQALCHEAAMKALEEDINATLVTKEHFDAAFGAITPRTPDSLIKIYKDYMNKVL